MLSRSRFNTTWKAAAGVALLLVSVTGCRHSEPANPEPPIPRAPKVKYSQSYDKEIREILELARANRWEEAQAKAEALRAQAPDNAFVERVRSWVEKEGQKVREAALEDELRSVDAKNSIFNPTIPSLLQEQKDRGLPPRKDLRDTIARIESERYIPETYGTVHRPEQGPLFDFDTAKGRMSKVLEKTVSVHQDNVPLETVLLNLSQLAGVNIISDKSLPALKQVLSINIEGVQLGELFRYLSRNYDLQFQVGDELVWVSDMKDPKKIMEETRFYRLRKGFILPAQFGNDEVMRTTTTANNVKTVQEVEKYKKFVNDNAPEMPALEQVITNLFTGSKYFIDYERNLVVAKGTPEQLDVMEEIIREFDRPVQQVLIEARFVTVTKPAFLQLGVLWETGRVPSAGRAPQDFTGLLNSRSETMVGIGIQETFTNVFGAAELSATISALEQTGESQTLSSPRLTVLNNRPATISDGKVQYYYEEYEVKTTSQQYYQASSFVPRGKPTKLTAGAELNVLASISGDGQSIQLALNPRVNTDVQMVKYATLTDYGPDGRLQSTFDINLPQYRTQELATRVVVNSGDTVVMGGVIERQRSTYVESVPVLGDIPYLGALFRRRTEQDIPRYLLVFVTATIVQDDGTFLIYARQPSTNSVVAPN